MRAHGLADPGSARDPADDPPIAVPVQPAAVADDEDGHSAAFPGGRVDRPGSARSKRDGDDLASLASDSQRSVSAFRAQVLDIGAGGFGDAQPVQGQQGDQGVLQWGAKPGGYQQGTEIVAVQGGGVRLIVQAGPPHVGGRGMVQEFLLDRVLKEPGDRAQPPGNGRASAASCFQVAGEAFDVGAADGEQGKGAGAAPGGELAQVQRIASRVSSRYPAR